MSTSNEEVTPILPLLRFLEHECSSSPFAGDSSYMATGAIQVGVPLRHRSALPSLMYQSLIEQRRVVDAPPGCTFHFVDDHHDALLDDGNEVRHHRRVVLLNHVARMGCLVSTLAEQQRQAHQRQEGMATSPADVCERGPTRIRERSPPTVDERAPQQRRRAAAPPHTHRDDTCWPKSTQKEGIFPSEVYSASEAITIASDRTQGLFLDAPNDVRPGSVVAAAARLTDEHPHHAPLSHSADFVNESAPVVTQRSPQQQAPHVATHVVPSVQPPILLPPQLIASNPPHAPLQQQGAHNRRRGMPPASSDDDDDDTRRPPPSGPPVHVTPSPQVPPHAPIAPRTVDEDVVIVVRQQEQMFGQQSVPPPTVVRRTSPPVDTKDGYALPEALTQRKPSSFIWCNSCSLAMGPSLGVQRIHMKQEDHKAAWLAAQGENDCTQMPLPRVQVGPRTFLTVPDYIWPRSVVTDEERAAVESGVSAHVRFFEEFDIVHFVCRYCRTAVPVADFKAHNTRDAHRKAVAIAVAAQEQQQLQ